MVENYDWKLPAPHVLPHTLWTCGMLRVVKITLNNSTDGNENL